MKRVLLFSLLITTVCSAVILSSPFIARENDSRLYARIVNDQKDRPWFEFVAPKWNGAEHYAEKETPYFRDHLFGMFFLPTILAKLGVNGMQATYVCALLYKTLTLIFFFLWLRLSIGDLKAGVIVLALQLNPQSMNYTLRANHESLLLMFMIMAIWANSAKHYTIAIVACLGAYLTKGLPGLIAPGILALQSYFLDKELVRSGLRFGIALIVCAIVSYGYEQWFQAATGYGLFEKYVTTQIYGRAVEETAKVSLFVTFFKSFGYYASRLFGYAVPWVVGLLFIKKLKPQDRSIWITALCVIIPYLFFFSFFSRTASRYIYPSFYFVMIVGALALLRIKKLPNWITPKRLAITNMATYILMFSGSLISNWNNYLEFTE